MLYKISSVEHQKFKLGIRIFDSSYIEIKLFDLIVATET
jgi:hypothetical protein